MYTPFRPSAKRKLQWTTPRPVVRFRPNPTTQVRRFNKTKVAGPSKAGTLTAQVKALQSFANKFKPEKKFFESSLTGTNIVNATGAIFRISDVPDGTLDSERVGFVINVSDIKFMLNYTVASPASAPPNGLIRLALVVDKEQVADTSPTAGQIFSGADPGAFPTSTNLERFNILWLGPLKEATRMSIFSGGIGTQSHSNEHYWKGNIKVQFNGAAGTDIEKNGIYLVVLLSGFGDDLDTTGTARIGFTDV